MSANRAVSFRERRNVLDSNFNQVAPPVVVKRQPLSQNNFQQLPSQPNAQQPHAYVNLLHHHDQQFNNYQNYHSHSNINNNFAAASNNSSLNSSSLHYHDVSHLNSSTGSSNVNNSMNSSWNSYSNSPNASLYAQQQQYYIRPRTSSGSKKTPPEVPKRTSSIQNTPPKYHQSHMHHGKHHHHHVIAPHHQQQFVQGKVPSGQFYKAENGNHSSPSSADSLSLSSNSPVPHWQQQQASIEAAGIQQQILHQQYLMEQKQLQKNLLIQQQNEMQLQAKLSETIRKRQYRIGLNLFNKKPEKGIAYLMHKNFLENSPHAVAKFLISRKGLSRQMIGEYLGNLQQSFNMAVLEYFAEEMDFSGLAIDVALKKFQGYFRMPGEAQKIERLMEVFSHRYGVCNPDVIEKLRSPDTVSHNNNALRLIH